MCNLMEDFYGRTLLQGEFVFLLTGYELPNLEKPFGQRGKCLGGWSYNFFWTINFFFLENLNQLFCANELASI